MARNRLYRDDGSGDHIGEHYYKAGGHVYEFFAAKPGERRAKVCFEETPEGNGRMLWEENGGLARFQAEFEHE